MFKNINYQINFKIILKDNKCQVKINKLILYEKRVVVQLVYKLCHRLNLVKNFKKFNLRNSLNNKIYL